LIHKEWTDEQFHDLSMVQSDQNNK